MTIFGPEPVEYANAFWHQTLLLRPLIVQSVIGAVYFGSSGFVVGGGPGAKVDGAATVS